ncbi:MAG: DAHL domain-containing protein [Pseudomonadota bacterium]
MNRRTGGAWAPVLAVIAALAICATLYQRTRAVDLRAHAELKNLLQHVRQVDADLAKGVLASRYGLVNQYDALTRSDADLDASRSELRARLDGAVSLDARTESAVVRLEAAERALRADVELFKTQNSVFKNSLLYLPEAGNSLGTKLAEESWHGAAELRIEIETLVRSTLVYNLLRTGTLHDSLISQQQVLASTPVVQANLRHDYAQFLRHARTVVQQQELVDPLVARISSSPLSRAVSELEALNDEHLERESARANRYRIALSAVVVLLIGLLSLIAQKLKRLYENLERKVDERTQKLADEKVALQAAERMARLNETRINAIIAGAREGIVRLGPNAEVRSWNPAAAQMFEAEWTLIQGTSFLNLAVLPEAQFAFLSWLTRVDTDGRVDRADYWHEISFVSASGRIFAAECSVARRDPAIDEDTTLFVRDISQDKLLEAELRQAQKLESVGRLASGIAHEINTPIQFVADSCFFIGEATKEMFRLIRAYSALLTKSTMGAMQEAVLAKAAALEEEADLAYLLDGVPKSIETMADGLSRVAELVAGMKTFAHPDQKEKVLVDLNHALKSTLSIACNEYKYVANVETDLVELPQVLCHAGEVNQVILNIIVNAAHAIAERTKGSDERGLITLRTRLEQDVVRISISDTGNGIPLEVQARIFDPFFTTKAVGRGTGQGLAIARSVVVDKHGGELSFETQIGEGTTFHIRLPIAEHARSAAAAA